MRFIDRSRRWLILSLCCCPFVAPPESVVFAYTPASDEVRALLNKALVVLENEDHGDPGGQALMAMAMLKAGVGPAHPKVQRAVASVRQFVGRVYRERTIGYHCYNAAVCCLFLLDLDHELYRSEIQILLDGIFDRQRPNGSWNYDMPADYEDTSQSQYGVLALWSAHGHGYQVDPAAVVRALNFFMRIQDPSGAWTYRAKDPNSFQRIEQAPPTLSMSAGGAGSVYVCGYLLGFGRRQVKPAAAPGVPAALRPVARPAEPGERVQSLSPDGANREMFRSTTQLANNWFATNTTFKMEPWTYYYMYGLERYKAFESLVEGKFESEPKWYNDGVDYLIKTQDSAGGWVSLHGQATRPISTSFAVLFLTRSTEQSIRKMEGQLRGGRTLPPDLTRVAVDASGRVIDANEPPPIEVLLKRLEADDQDDLDLSIPSRITLAENSDERNSQLARLRRLVTRGPYEIRLMAVNTLARDRNLDNVPALIYALSDSDPRIVRAARDGLRFISRKIDGFGMPANPTASELQAARSKWSDWFLSVRPDGVLIE